MTNQQPTHREQLIAEMEAIQKRWNEIQSQLAELDRGEHSQTHSHLWAYRLSREQAWLQQQQAAQEAAQQANAAGWQAKQQADAERQAEIDQVAREAAKMFPNVRR